MVTFYDIIFRETFCMTNICVKGLVEQLWSKPLLPLLNCYVVEELTALLGPVSESEIEVKFNF